MSKPVLIGTRGSALALWQANTVRDALRQAHPETEFELCVVKTTGDINLSTPMAEIGDKGLFTKELEVELLEGRVDMCVHSMKDVPTELPVGCTIAAMLPRADVRDVLVAGPRIEGVTALADLPEGTRLATGSVRRTAQLLAQYPNIKPLPVRGNVDTRIAKAKGPDYEGGILAAAGIQRLDRSDEIVLYLSVDEMVPAIGQGAVGVEIREDDERTRELLAAVNCPDTFACVSAERTILAALEGGCQVPVGAHICSEEDMVVGTAIVLSLDGSQQARAKLIEPRGEGAHESMAQALLAELYDQGAEPILEQIREGLE